MYLSLAIIGAFVGAFLALAANHDEEEDRKASREFPSVPDEQDDELD